MPSRRYYDILAARQRDKERFFRFALRMTLATMLWLAPYSALVGALVVTTLLSPYFGSGHPVLATIGAGAALGFVFGAFLAIPLGFVRARIAFVPTDTGKVTELRHENERSHL